MSVQRKTAFAPADRYVFDFKLCSYANGWAQMDTEQDASYYGTWTNPDKKEIATYCEGDISRVVCETDEEYKTEIFSVVNWNKENGYWLGIDPGFDPAMKQKFIDLGFVDLLH